MILPLLLGIAMLVWGGINFRKYLLFITGIKMKGTVTQAGYKEQGIRRKVAMAEITYKYEIDGKEYTNTEISDEQKHLFKTQSMKGETIAIMVRKNAPEIATLRSSGHYIKSFIFFLTIGLLSALVGIASM
ncbi:DUF3592 domain-containing protein [Maribacter polysiphoniae]|uniref:DUF3592 domain-containing protein n=1 Tax=Maribacter polysiphoniae TaxID=429344 RepID=UPI00235368CB|nr:DUF3592 domain-containing protein [Maribacter polysiphoniae]